MRVRRPTIRRRRRNSPCYMRFLSCTYFLFNVRFPVILYEYPNEQRTDDYQNMGLTSAVMMLPIVIERREDL